ncbi:hypothetical protein OIA54_000483 [Escherichia coli]|uniref:hypothetical protein n=1 Tax=Escherichia coli TaxID=562 RepID=UPI00131C449C|nr:hypothetical protein [Escherichia coli]EEU3018808.1 hypothetical protein [Escherichia coli]EFA7269064.1 hypothetical protein [Escherichia coli]EFE9806536.1 hypothetical protein [Escherichia coli]EFF0701076.1 hypothetical protein [Escherichia coli]EFF7727283.1 hypothetical protein [Escherichia coli]
MPGTSNGAFPLPRPLANWCSVAGSAASGTTTREDEAFCLSVHPSGLPVGRQVQSMETERGLSCGAHFRGARCQPSVSSTGNIIACTRRVLHSH